MKNNSKISIALAAVNQLSKPVDAGTKSVGRLKTEVSETAKTLKGFEKNQAMVTRFKGLSSGLDVTRQKLAGSKAEIKRLTLSEREAVQVVTQHSAALKSAEQAVLEAAQAYGAESDEVMAANKEVARLTKTKKKAETALKKERAALKSAKNSADRLTTSYGKQAKTLGGLRRDIGAAGLKLNALGAEELRLAKKTEQANNSLERQKRKLKDIHTIQGRINARNAQKGELVGEAAGLAVKAAPMVLAGRRAVNYESTFADVKKVVDFSTEKQGAAYRSDMLKLAGNLGGENAQNSLAEIVTQAGQSGIEKKELLAFGTTASKIKVAWDVEAQKAGKTLATWRAAMGLSQKDTLDLADATNYLGNNMNAQAKDIAAVMVRQGSTAMGAGLSYNDTAALSASLIAGGATEETAATALKNISGRLTAGYAATGSQKEALGKIGFDAQELAGDMQADAQGTLIEVFRALEDVSAKERGAVISQLFGEEIKGAVSKLVTTLDDDKNGLIAAFYKVSDANKKANGEIARSNSVEDEYNKRTKTRAFMLSQLNAKFDRMTILVGDALLPVLDAVVPPLMSVVDGIGNFVETSPGLTSGLLGAAAAMATLKAGAIAFKLARLSVGNGADRFKLGKSKLSRSTDQTTISANRASMALDRMNRKMSRLGGGGYGSDGGYGGDYDSDNKDKKDKKGRKRKRSRFGGKWGRLAGIVGTGATFSLLSGSANASDMALAGADVMHSAGALSGGLSAAGALQGASKVFKPASIALSGVALSSALSDGDSAQIGATTGDIAGGIGGAWAGGVGGAALGSLILPVVGTAIGGAIGTIAGGLGGGSVGHWIGEKIGTWFAEDKTEKPAPAQVSAQAKQLAQVNKQVTFSPVINLTPSGDPQYDQSVGEQLIERMRAEFAPVMLGMEVYPGNTSLTDGGNT